MWTASRGGIGWACVAPDEAYPAGYNSQTAYLATDMKVLGAGRDGRKQRLGERREAPPRRFAVLGVSGNLFCEDLLSRLHQRACGARS